MEMPSAPSSYLYLLPTAVLEHIYAYDTTVRDTFSQSVLHDLHRKTFATSDYLDRAYTIRNWHEPWGVVPRYILPEDGRVYGSYIRGRKRIHTPL